MARTSVKPSAEIVKITPEQAEEWLNKNTHNRPLRERHINELKEAIERGEWKLNGDAIRFDKTGTLSDGQHRLWAIALSGVPVESLVVWDLDRDAQLTIDQVARRRLSDHLRMMGYVNSVSLAAVVNMKWKLDNGFVRTGRTPTVQQALQVLKEHPEITEGVVMASHFHTRFHGSTAGIGALYYEFSLHDADAAAAFFEQLVSGTNLTATSPIYALRRQLETQKLGTVMLMALTIKAWNAYIEGREVGNLTWRPVGKHPESFPEIHGPSED